MAVWVIRSGSIGERDAWCLENGFAGGGWSEVGDLTGADSREKVREIVMASFPGGKKGLIDNYTAQLWALRGWVKVGDIVVLPLKTTSRIAFGVCTSELRYDANAMPGYRHIIGVEWKVTDVPRTSVKQDLLYTLGAFLTVFKPARHDAEWRLEQIMSTGSDPGSRQGIQTPVPPVEDLPESSDGVDIAEVSRNAIRAHLIENFSGHAMASLIGDILQAKGLTTRVTDPGPDQGIDVIAAGGPLGLDSPRIVVQVKSDTSPVGVDVVQRLQGALQTTGADQGLLVAWGGINKPAQAILNHQQFRVRVWDSENIIDEICAVYERLPESTRGVIPLRQIWMLS